MDNLSRIREILDRITELSSEELASLKEDIVSEFGTVRAQELSETMAKNLEELANFGELVRNEEKTRADRMSELALQVAAAENRLNADSSITEASADDNVVDVDNEEAFKEAREGIDTPEDGNVVEVDNEEAFKEAREHIDASQETQEVVEEEQLSQEVHDDNLEAEKDAEEEEARKEAVEDDEEEEEEEEKKDEFSSDNSDTSAKAPVESETATVTNPEAELASTENIEEKISEAEFNASEEVNKESSEEPVTASINSDELDNVKVPGDNSPVTQVKTIEAPVTITAGADIPHVPAGSELPDLKAVASAIIARKQGMGRTSGGDGEFHQVATFTTSYPESRYLTRNDIEINRAKVESIVAPKALTAAGGLMAPVPIRYELFGLGSTKRPVKDSLAVFGAERGGIRFVTPPVITDLTGAVSLWTLQDDIDASTVGAPDPVKPCLRVSPGAEVVVYLEAIPLCLTFGNMGARAYPELVERHTELAMVAHARFAETRLLTRIGSLSTAVTSTSKLGAARDVFALVDQAAAGYRNRHRIDVNAPLRAIFPEWFKNALRADLIKQLPGDGNEDTFGLAENKINSWFKLRNINVTWTMDGESGQMFGTQAVGALSPFPTNVIWYLFAEGTFLFLDGGTLDLGLVRDSTLNSTNDYKIFLETFEGVAKVGVESLRVTTPVILAGASAATVVTP